MKKVQAYDSGMSTLHVNPEAPAKKLFTVDEFERMNEAGILHPDLRFELIRGEIIQMPIGLGMHSGRVNKLTRLFTSRFGDSVIVSVQNPLIIDEYSAPKPDVAILKPLEDFFGLREPNPDDVLFLIEISDTSLRFDTKIKLQLYAEAGVREYWILDIQHTVLMVLTEPVEGEYRKQEIFRRGQTICPKALPHVSFSLDDILG
jgi:Uma2 family endonuclease